MTAIGSIGGAVTPIAAPRALTHPVTADGGGDINGSGGDALAPMRGALETAFAIGRPADKADAAAILATSDDFLAGAQATLGNLDAGMQQRGERLASGTGTPAQQAEDREQLQLMQVLRDRIQQSVDHATKLLGGDDPEAELGRAALLMPDPRPQHAEAIDPTLVAGAYARGFGMPAAAG